jgi:chemotaxis protein MotB
MIKDKNSDLLVENKIKGVYVRNIKKANPTWLVTFVDLISLLLAFFLMLYSMSSIKTKEWAAFSASLEKIKLETPNKKVGSKENLTSAVSVANSPGLDITYLRSVIESAISSDPLLSFIRFNYKGDKLILSFPSSLIFQPGSAVLLPKGRSALFLLSEKLSNLDNKIALVGHSDPDPISVNGKYRNNWILSLVRASAVANSLIKAGYRKPLNILSLADTQFSSNKDASLGDRVYERARRVDIVIYSERDNG